MSIFARDSDTQKDMEYMHEVDAAMHRRGHPWAFTLSLAVLLFFFVFFLWADNAMIDDVTRGMGQVIPAQGVQPIQSERGGSITAILVGENETVERNQPLLTISNVTEVAGLRELQTKHIEMLFSLKRLGAEEQGAALVFSDAERSDYPEAVSSQERLFKTRNEQFEGQMLVLTSSIAARQSEVEAARSQHETVTRSLASAREEEAIYRPMVGRSISENQYKEVERKIVGLEGELLTLEQGIARAESAVDAAEERLGSLRAERQTGIIDEIKKIRLELGSVEQQIRAGSEHVTRTELRSPVKGTVKRIVLKKESVAKPAETIMEIIPTEGALEIEARFSPQDRGFLFVNQPAMVKVSAYEFSIYGGLEAVVTKISTDTIEDKRGDPWYEVRFLTKRKSILYRGEELEILPGMTVTVDVLTDKKSVLSHIIGPIRRGMQNAMTEH